jgi:hypothetical protein
MEKYVTEKKEKKKTRDSNMTLSAAMPTGPYDLKYADDRNHRTV